SVVVWQMSIACATWVAVTAVKSAVVAHEPVGVVSLVAASQSLFTPSPTTSSAPGLTSLGDGQFPLATSQQSPLHVVHPSPSTSGVLSMVPSQFSSMLLAQISYCGRT